MAKQRIEPERSLKANLAAFGYACVHPLRFPGVGMLYVRNGRIVTQKQACAGWEWLRRLARKRSQLTRSRRG